MKCVSAGCLLHSARLQDRRSSQWFSPKTWVGSLHLSYYLCESSCVLKFRTTAVFIPSFSYIVTTVFFYSVEEYVCVFVCTENPPQCSVLRFCSSHQSSWVLYSQYLYTNVPGQISIGTIEANSSRRTYDGIRVAPSCLENSSQRA